MEFTKEIEKIILDSLQKTVPVAAKKDTSTKALIDRSTKELGFSKITRKGYTMTVDLLIPRPTYPTNFDFIDADIKTITTYLYEQVNQTFYDALKGNIIKTVRYENDPFIPTVDFPVLKVYKTGYDEEADVSPQTSTKITIAYALAYTQRTKIASVCSFVADEIVRLLKNGSFMDLFQLDYEKGITVEFEDFINPDNVIYKYATITCNIYQS